MKRLFTITTILLSPALMAEGFSVELGGIFQEKTWETLPKGFCWN